MSGTYTLAPQYRLDSENYLGGSIAGTYNAAEKIQCQMVVTGATGGQLTYVAGTPLTLTWSTVTISKIVSFWFSCDQGTSTYPVILHFTCSTAGFYVPMIAGQAIYWDSSQIFFTDSGLTTPSQLNGASPFNGAVVTTTWTTSGASITGLTINIPAGLALTSPGTTNLSGRIALSP